MTSGNTSESCRLCTFGIIIAVPGPLSIIRSFCGSAPSNFNNQARRSQTILFSSELTQPSCFHYGPLILISRSIRSRIAF
jgi:hypothetical protein